MMSMMIRWNRTETPGEFHSILFNLGKEFPLSETEGTPIRFEKAEDPAVLKITQADGVYTVICGRPFAVARGVARVLAGLTGRESIPEETPAILIDCTGTGLYTESILQGIFRRLALLGFGKIMLCPERDDAIFRYSPQDIHRISECAADLKLELGSGHDVQNTLNLGVQDRLWCDHAETVRSAELSGSKICAIRGGRDFGCFAPGSMFADLAWFAGRLYHADESAASKIFRAVFSGSYELRLKAGEIERTERKTADNKLYRISSASLLWDDPLHAVCWREGVLHSSAIWTNTLPEYRKLAEELSAGREEMEGGNLNLAWNFCNVLAQKIELRLLTIRAYCRRDLQTLDIISEERIPDMIEAVEGLSEVWRSEWLRWYYPSGLEVIQIRLAGLCERYRELGRRIDSFLNGEIPSIPELELLAPEKADSERTATYRATASQNLI